MVFMLLLLSKNKSEIWFQYLVYKYIIHTCNTKDNIYIAISTSDIYGILFNVKEIQFLLEMLSKNTHGN